jgi:hypothetical protein
MSMRLVLTAQRDGSVLQVAVAVDVALDKAAVVMTTHDDILTSGFPFARFSGLLFLAPATTATTRQQVSSILQRLPPTTTITAIEVTADVSSRAHKRGTNFDAEVQNAANKTHRVSSEPLTAVPNMCKVAGQPASTDHVLDNANASTLDMMMLGSAADKVHIPDDCVCDDSPTSPTKDVQIHNRLAAGSQVTESLQNRTDKDSPVAPGFVAHEKSAAMQDQSTSFVDALNTSVAQSLLLITCKRTSQVHRYLPLNQALVKVCFCNLTGLPSNVLFYISHLFQH